MIDNLNLNFYYQNRDPKNSLLYKKEWDLSCHNPQFGPTFFYKEKIFIGYWKIVIAFLQRGSCDLDSGTVLFHLNSPAK